MFPHIDIPLRDYFELGPYKANHLDTLHDHKLSINSIFQKLGLTVTHKSELEWWDSFINSVTNSPNFLANVISTIQFTEVSQHCRSNLSNQIAIASR